MQDYDKCKFSVSFAHIYQGCQYLWIVR